MKKQKLPLNAKKVLEDPNIEKIFANAIFDIAVLKLKHGITIKGEIHDVLQMAHLIDENGYSYSLENIANIYTDLKNIKAIADGVYNSSNEITDKELVERNGLDCLMRTTKVQLSDGTFMDIDKIVRNKLSVKVLSYN